MGKDNTEHRAENKKYNRTLLYIGAAVFLATILFVVFFPSGKSKVYIADTPVSSPTSAQNTAASAPPAVAVPANTKAPESLEIKKADTPVAVPFIYEKNNDIYMASGKNHTKLGSRQSLYGCYKEMNCALSEDNRFLYYIEKTDINTGMGTLKKISTDTVYSPVTIEEGVCAAEVSADGSIMYIKNAEGITGELYLYKDEKSSFISKNVLPVFLRFSKGGSCISYVVKEGSGAFALYVKKNGEKPALVTRFTAEATLNDGLNLSRFNGAVPFDTGAVLYSIEENYNMPLYFYDSSGKTETICGDGYIIKTYPGGDFLYADIAKNNLWYKQPGSKAVNITVNYSYSRFPKNTDRFLLIEHTGDGFENSRVMMYEVDEKKEKTAISLGDDAIFEINAAFDCVAYESGGVLYASRKTDSGWREVLLLEASAGISPGSKSGIVARFDEAGENLYFFDEYKCSPLYRYSLKDGKTVKLIDNVDKLDVYENAVYAHIPSDKLYRIEGGTKKMISEGVREVRETEGERIFFSTTVRLNLYPRVHRTQG